MSLSGSIIGMAVTLGIIDLALGWLLGRYCSRRPASIRQAQEPDPVELRDVAQRLAEQVARVHQEVDQHQGRVERVNRSLLAVRSTDEGARAESVLESVAEILRINARLQDRLLDAEDRLQEQGREIESWMTEARTDPLTGLPNRRAFDKRSRGRFTNGSARGRPFR